MKSATTKQLGLIQWLIRMNKPEFEKFGGYKNIKTIDVEQASKLIDMMKKEWWDDVALYIEQLHPNK